MHFYILTLSGGHFEEKNSKKIQSFRGCGENDHNSIHIKASTQKSLAFDREPNFGQNQAKMGHWV